MLRRSTRRRVASSCARARKRTDGDALALVGSAGDGQGQHRRSGRADHRRLGCSAPSTGSARRVGSRQVARGRSYHRREDNALRVCIRCSKIAPSDDGTRGSVTFDRRIVERLRRCGSSLRWLRIAGNGSGSLIRVPAGFCGVYGLKPTFGLVPTEGVVPVSWTLDHVGPIARTARDLALILAALVPDGRVRSGGSGARRNGTPHRGGHP